MLQVSVEDMKVGGSGSKRAMGGVTVGDETIRARYVVNAAGGASDKIAKMVRVHPHPHPNPHPNPTLTRRGCRPSSTASRLWRGAVW